MERMLFLWLVSLFMRVRSVTSQMRMMLSFFAVAIRWLFGEKFRVRTMLVLVSKVLRGRLVVVFYRCRLLLVFLEIICCLSGEIVVVII